MEFDTFLNNNQILNCNLKNPMIYATLQLVYNSLTKTTRGITENSLKLELRKKFGSDFKANQLGYWLSRGWSEEDATQKIKALQKGRTKNQIDYWLKQGFTIENTEVEVTKFQQEQANKASEKGSHKGKFSKEWFEKKYGDLWEIEYKNHNEKKTSKIKKSNLTDDEWKELVEKKNETYYSKSDIKRKEINERRTKLLDKGNNELYSEEDFIKKFGEVKGKLKWKIRNEKISEQMKEKSAFRNPEIQVKCKDTMFEKYGELHAMHVPEFRDKQAASLAEIFSCKERKNEIVSKRYNTIDEKYGSRENYLKTVNESFNKTVYSKLGGKEYSKEMLIDNLKTLTPTEIAENFGVSHDYIMRRIRFFDVTYAFNNISTPHKKIRNILIENNIEFLENKRILDRKEIDIWIPSKNLGIEINGIFWHSEISGKKDEHYHLNKTEIANEKGIDLLHFTDHEIANKFEITKSLILSYLFEYEIGTNLNYEIRQVSEKIKIIFLDENHIHGNCNDFNNLGLFIDGTLVELLCFKKIKKSKYQIFRHCTKNNYFGEGKLLKYFIENTNPRSIEFLIDRRYFSIYSLKKIGFVLERIISPSFTLLDKNYKIDLSENIENWEKLKESGYDRIWDCGFYQMIWKK